MLTPDKLGLPPKFTSWRKGQLPSVVMIDRSKEYCFLLDAPTGSGKSLTGAAVQKMSKNHVVYLTTTKQLQDQLLGDFPYARTLKGRNNYKCLKMPKLFPSISAEHCTHSEKGPCHLQFKCPYMVAKLEALAAPLAVLNTAYFLAEANYAGAFSGAKRLIIDECDTIEDHLMSFIELVITQRQLDRLQVPPPRFKTKFESWVDWAGPTCDQLTRELHKLEETVGWTDDWATIPIDDLRRAKDLEKLISKLEAFIFNVDKNWVWYPESDRWTFKPVWVSKYSERALWRHAEKVVGMSATILDPKQMDRNIGLSSHDRSYQYHELPSLFPKENRPVFYEPSANMTFKTMDAELPRLAVAMDKILDNHAGEKILVHTVSYRVRDYLMKHLTPRSRLMSHDVKDRVERLDEFKRSKQPRVLVSPSMDRGVDLPEEECRVVIIAKVPYPNLGDPQIKKRVYASKDGNHWYAHKTTSTVIQMSGRAVRSENDRATTYILDEQFGRLYDDNKQLFPEWFKEALIT